MDHRWPALFVLALVMLGTPAAGQGLNEEVRVEDHTVSDTVPPGGPAVNTTLTVHVPCNPGDAGEAWVRAESTQPPTHTNVSVGSVTASLLDACPPDGGSFSVKLPIQVSVTPAAPAYHTIQATIPVLVDKNRTQASSQTLGPVDGILQFYPAYLNRIHIEPIATEKSASPGDRITFPIRVESQSNGPTRFEFHIENPEQVSGSFQAITPQPTVLGRPEPGTTATGTAIFEVYTPATGFVNEDATIEVHMRSFYAADTTVEGDTQRFTLQVSATGISITDPGTIAGMLVFTGIATFELYRRFRL